MLFILVLAVVSIFFAFGIYILIYVWQSKFINSFNELVNGTKTNFAWIPFIRIYILGKLVVNKLVGLILVVVSLMLLTANYLYPLIIMICFYIYAFYKFNKLKK